MLQIPLELAFNGLPRDESVVELIHEKVAKLEKICDHIISCRVLIDRPQETKNPYGITVLIRVPPENEIVVRRESVRGQSLDSLAVLVREAFEAAHRQLKELVERQRGRVKAHAGEAPQAVVASLFEEDGYGFIRTVDEREVYFHKNSVRNGGFAKLRIGTGVRFEETMGDDGPQATVVEIAEHSRG